MKQRRDSKQRQMILDLVHQHSDHPSADQIYLEARSINDKISRGTVYRNLDVLVQDHQISMVKMHGINRYDWKLQPHYHFACSVCGAVMDFPMTYCERLDEAASKEPGFHIQRHHILFEGICPQCQKNN